MPLAFPIRGRSDQYRAGKPSLGRCANNLKSPKLNYSVWGFFRQIATIFQMKQKAMQLDGSQQGRTLELWNAHNIGYCRGYEDGNSCDNEHVAPRGMTEGSD